MKNVISRLLPICACLIFSSIAGTLSAGTAPALEMISPKNGDNINYEMETVIAISIYDEEGDVNASSMKLEVDGEDVTRKANTSVFLVTYSFPGGTVTGRHYIAFSVSDNEGNSAQLDSYFNILAEPKVEPKVTFNGTVGVGAEYDKEAPQSAIGNFNLEMYGSLSPSLDYALLIDATNRESTDLQRVSRFRFDLYSPWGSLVLGDTTPVFTDYTIDGKRVFGIHMLPQFGWFGLEFVWGQTYRGEQEVDTFRQMLFGGRLKLGRPESFLWGLSFLKVEDDPDSISYLTDPDVPTPQDNVVLGTDFNFNFSNGRVKLVLEANESLLNTDTTGGSSSIEDTGWDFSSIDWLFTVNEYVVPLIPGLSNLAAKGGLTIGPFADNTFYGEYSWVGPSYFSLANTAIINDRQGFLLRDSLWLLNRALFINAGFQRYTDNLESTSDYTTTNTGGSGAVYVYPTPYLSINAGVDVATVKNAAPTTNSVAVNNLNTVINAGIAQDVAVLSSDTNVYFTTTATLFKDRNNAANDADIFTTRLGAISYFTGFPLDTKAVVGYDFGDQENSVYVEGYAGYRFLRTRTLYPYLGASYYTALEQLDLRSGLDYDVTPDMKITAEVQYVTSSATIGDNLFISAFATYNF